MPATSRSVSVELAVGKVTCPGVWLCSNGKISLQISLMDSVIQTDSHHPNFPIIVNEHFIFYKKFINVGCLTALQRSFGNEFFNVDLIQWKNCSDGVILANFCSTLADLVHPSNITNIKKKTAHVDVLMEPTKLFPGTIGPKLELVAHASIEETPSIEMPQKVHKKSKKSYIPLEFRREKTKVYPKKVCHTIAYSEKQQRCPKVNPEKRPMFKYRKPDDNLILRTNPNVVTHEHVLTSRSQKKPKVIDECSSDAGVLSSQETAGHSFVKRLDRNHRKQSCSESKHSLCPICSKYICTFSKDLRTSATNATCCLYCDEKFLAPEENGTCSNATADNHSVKKVCFCLPAERATNLVKQLHERVLNSLTAGSDAIESCFAECTICE